MSVVCMEENELTEFAEDIGIPPTGCTFSLEHPPTDVRRDKILEIRTQLADGTYDVDDRLDALLERLLEELYI